MMPRSTTSSTCSSMRMLSLATKWTILHTLELRNEKKAKTTRSHRPQCRETDGRFKRDSSPKNPAPRMPLNDAVVELVMATAQGTQHDAIDLRGRGRVEADTFTS